MSAIITKIPASAVKHGLLVGVTVVLAISASSSQAKIGLNRYIAVSNTVAMSVAVTPMRREPVTAVKAKTKSTQSKSTQAPAPLSGTMTLKRALSLASQSAPVIEEAVAELNLAKAKARQLQARYHGQLSFQSQLRWIDPTATSSDQSNNDSAAGLVYTKTLYDFGRRSALAQSSQAEVRSQQLYLKRVKIFYQIDIMSAFFNVILADLKYTADNEAMAVAYLDLDRAKANHKLGKANDLQVAKANAVYQKSRALRYHSDVNRRIAREIFSALLNRPGELLSSFSHPKFKLHKLKNPDIDQMLQLAMKNNSQLRILRAQLKAKRYAIKAARKKFGPQINLNAGTYEYNRETNNRNNSQLELELKVPLWSGGRQSSHVAKANAEYQRQRARYQSYQLKLRVAIVKACERIYVLKAKLDAMYALNDSRELDLDKARARYQQGVEPSLGKTQAPLMAAQYQLAKTQFELAIAWANLNALVAKPLFDGFNFK